jgi:hypothetical protein
VMPVSSVIDFWHVVGGVAADALRRIRNAENDARTAFQLKRLCLPRMSW